MLQREAGLGTAVTAERDRKSLMQLADRLPLQEAPGRPFLPDHSMERLYRNDPLGIQKPHRTHLTHLALPSALTHPQAAQASKLGETSLVIFPTESTEVHGSSAKIRQLWLGLQRQVLVPGLLFPCFSMAITNCYIMLILGGTFKGI